jgi:hypothetical protein
LWLRHWEDCAARQQEIYRSVCAYLAPPDGTAAQLFSPRLLLEGLGQRFGERAISSEQDLESYERFGVENYVHDIIAELCKNPAARDQFGLGDGVKFDNHANALDQTEIDLDLLTEPPTHRRSRPDQFCIRRVECNNNGCGNLVVLNIFETVIISADPFLIDLLVFIILSFPVPQR